MKFLPLLLIQVINKLRINNDLPIVTYNYTLHNELNNFKETYGSNWFLLNTTLPDCNYTKPLVYNDDIIFKRSCYKRNSFRILEYSNFTEYRQNDWNYLFHDTNNGNVAKTIKYRIRQRHCFDFDLCLSKDYNYYAYCLKNKPTNESRKPCSWAWQYYPKLLISSLEQISCVLLDVPGFALPTDLVGIQHKSFYCYGKHGKELTDYPFSN